MTEVTDDQIREHFASASPANETETEVRACLARAAVRLNNLLVDCPARDAAFQGLDTVLGDALGAVVDPDVVQPDTVTDPPEADAPTEPGQP